MRTSVVLTTALALAVFVAAAVMTWPQSEARAAGTDTTPPTVTRTAPAAGATCVDPAADASAFFSEDMKASSINDTTIMLFRKDSATRVAASIRYSGVRDRAIIDPTNPLEGNVTYRAVVTTYAKDLAGNRLDQDGARSSLQRKAWTFTTSPDSQTPLECQQARQATVQNDLRNAATAASACAADHSGFYSECVTVAQLVPYGFDPTDGVVVNGMNGNVSDWSASMQHSGGGSAYTYATFGDNAGEVVRAPRGTSAPALPDRTAEWEALAESDTRNAATAATAYAADNNGEYTGLTMLGLVAHGFVQSPNVTTTISVASANRVVIQSFHSYVPGVYYQYDSDTGVVQRVPSA